MFLKHYIILGLRKKIKMYVISRCVFCAIIEITYLVIKSCVQVLKTHVSFLNGRQVASFLNWKKAEGGKFSRNLDNPPRERERERGGQFANHGNPNPLRSGWATPWKFNINSKCKFKKKCYFAARKSWGMPPVRRPPRCHVPK